MEKLINDANIEVVGFLRTSGRFLFKGEGVFPFFFPRIESGFGFFFALGEDGEDVLNNKFAKNCSILL